MKYYLLKISTHGKGRTTYEKKRALILSSLSHGIEIDLLRGNLPMTMMGTVLPTDYRIVVSRSSQRPKADLYGFNLTEPIPSFPLPLKLEDEEVTVDLQTIFDGVCERAWYNQRIDYQQPVPSPALSQAEQQWVDELLTPIRRGGDTAIPPLPKASHIQVLKLKQEIYCS